MIIKSIKLFLQNVCQNRVLTNIILETNRDFNIIFIQEPPWSTIHTIPNSFNKEGDKVVSTPNHLNWIAFSRSTSDENDYPRVISYINICLVNLHFSLHKNIFNHKDIYCFFFFNNRNTFFLLNFLFWCSPICFKVSKGYWSGYLKYFSYNW